MTPEPSETKVFTVEECDRHLMDDTDVLGYDFWLDRRIEAMVAEGLEIELHAEAAA